MNILNFIHLLQGWHATCVNKEAKVDDFLAKSQPKEGGHEEMHDNNYGGLGKQDLSNRGTGYLGEVHFSKLPKKHWD